MATITIPAGTPVEHSIERDSGDRWFAVMEREDGTLIAADTLTELVADLIDDYPLADADEAALELRIDFAVAAATMRQAGQAFVLQMEGVFDPETESEEALSALFADRELPVAEISVWDHAVPLILVSTAYAPFTGVERPTGNIQWIDPSDDASLLRSLVELGDIRLWIDGE